jgi:hypothetical protein
LRSEQFRRELQHFILYFEKYWMNMNRVGQWNLFDINSHYTTSLLEAYHSTLATILGVHPSFFVAVRGLHEIYIHQLSGFQLSKIDGWHQVKIRAADIKKYRTRKLKTVAELLEELDPNWIAEQTLLENNYEDYTDDSEDNKKCRAWVMFKNTLHTLALDNGPDSNGKVTTGVEKLQLFLTFLTGFDVIPLYPNKWSIVWSFDPDKGPKAQSCFAQLSICASRYCVDHGPGNLSFQNLMDADIRYLTDADASRDFSDN